MVLFLFFKKSYLQVPITHTKTTLELFVCNLAGLQIASNYFNNKNVICWFPHNSEQEDTKLQIFEAGLGVALELNCLASESIQTIKSNLKCWIEFWTKSCGWCTSLLLTSTHPPTLAGRPFCIWPLSTDRPKWLLKPCSGNYLDKTGLCLLSFIFPKQVSAWHICQPHITTTTTKTQQLFWCCNSDVVGFLRRRLV